MDNRTIIRRQIGNFEVDFIKGDKISSGSDGTAYHATFGENKDLLGNEKSKELHKKLFAKKWIIKELSPVDFHKTEPQICSYFNITSNAADTEDNLISWVTEYIPGKDFWFENLLNEISLVNNSNLIKKLQVSNQNELFLYKNENQDNKYLYYLYENNTIAEHHFILEAGDAEQLNAEFNKIEDANFYLGTDTYLGNLILNITCEAGHTVKADHQKILQLIFELVVRTNHFHHPRIKNKVIFDAIIHGDINGFNVHFDIDEKPKELPKAENDYDPEYCINSFYQPLKAAYIDYGFSAESNGDPEELRINPATLNIVKQVNGKHGLTKKYFPPEAYLNSQFGIKTDVFMLAKLLKEILLEIFPDTSKIHSLVKNYLAKSLSENYSTRPDSDEFLKFITMLNNYHRISHFEPTPQRNEKEINALKEFYISKLNLFCEDKWNTLTKSKNEEGENISLGDLCSHDGTSFALTYVALQKNGLMNKEIMKKLADNIEFCDSFTKFGIPDQLSLYDVLESITNGSNDGSSKNKELVARQRELAIALIENELKKKTTATQVDDVISQLENSATNGSLHYLYSRQGWFTTLSIHMHSYKDNKGQTREVSATWLKIMNLTQRRKRQLVELKDFKNAYNADYNDACCVRRMFSKMSDQIDNIGLTIHDVIAFAEKNPSSRTARKLDELANRSNQLRPQQQDNVLKV